MKIRRFFESVYHDNQLRTARVRDIWGDLLRYAGNTALRPLEETLIERYRDPERPIVFVVAVPRSGTTLLYQLLARYARIGYPNNFMARFWMAPIVGGITYRSLYRDAGDIPLESHLGATPGPGSPHEFSWFWEYWTEFGDVDDHTRDELRDMNWRAIRRELQGLAGWFDRPLVLKSINYVNYHIEWISEQIPSSRFIWIERSTPHVAQSIYQSRVERYEDPSIWWSVRPRDVDAWLDEPPECQIAHQIHDIRRAIEEGLRTLPTQRVWRTSYEELTTSPVDTLREFESLADTRLRDLDDLASLDLAPRNERRLPDETFESLTRALEELDT